MLSEYPEVLTLAEVCRILRLKDERTVRNLAARGGIPGAFRLGHAWRFTKQGVLALLGEQQHPGCDCRDLHDQ